MNSAAKFGSYLLGLAVVFGGALGAGKAVGPLNATPAAADHTAMTTSTHGAESGGHEMHEQAADTPGGLQVSQDGYTLTPLTTTIKAGEPTDYRFAVIGPDGRPVTGYQVQHDKELHFIVVSRDLGSFQHLHPVRAADGTWSVPLTLPASGPYRVFADFVPAGHAGLTLGADLFAAGDYTPEALPATSRTAAVDGYTVTLDGDLVPGRSSKLTLSVSKDGRPVTDLQPYLGAYGHLVALRAGDLAYLHVHPDSEPGDGTTQPGPGIILFAEVPSRGDYRLFLDFQHGGTVRTAAFTLGTGPAPAPTVPAPTATATAAPTGHDEHGH